MFRGVSYFCQRDSSSECGRFIIQLFRDSSSWSCADISVRVYIYEKNGYSVSTPNIENMDFSISTSSIERVLKIVSLAKRIEETKRKLSYEKDMSFNDSILFAIDKLIIPCVYDPRTRSVVSDKEFLDPRISLYRGRDPEKVFYGEALASSETEARQLIVEQLLKKEGGAEKLSTWSSYECPLEKEPAPSERPVTLTARVQAYLKEYAPQLCASSTSQ